MATGSSSLDGMEAEKSQQVPVDKGTEENGHRWLWCTFEVHYIDDHDLDCHFNVIKLRTSQRQKREYKHLQPKTIWIAQHFLRASAAWANLSKEISKIFGQTTFRRITWCKLDSVASLWLFMIVLHLQTEQELFPMFFVQLMQLEDSQTCEMFAKFSLSFTNSFSTWAPCSSFLQTLWK